jgi:hypothetical protein
MFKNKKYRFSKSYDAVFESIKAGDQLICVIDAIIRVSTIKEGRTVAIAKIENDYFTIEVSAATYSKVQNISKNKFISECERLNVEFLKY